MRTNTYPTRTTIKRAHDNINPICRACGRANKTLGHILGQSLGTKSKRIKRHNEIVDMLKQQLAGSCMVMVEPTIDLQGERFKHDFVIQNKKGIFVLDVTVRYENMDFLAVAAQEISTSMNVLPQSSRLILKQKWRELFRSSLTQGALFTKALCRN